MTKLIVGCFKDPDFIKFSPGPFINNPGFGVSNKKKLMAGILPKPQKLQTPKFTTVHHKSLFSIFSGHREGRNFSHAGKDKGSGIYRGEEREGYC